MAKKTTVIPPVKEPITLTPLSDNSAVFQKRAEERLKNLENNTVAQFAGYDSTASFGTVSSNSRYAKLHKEGKVDVNPFLDKNLEKEAEKQQTKWDVVKDTGSGFVKLALAGALQSFGSYDPHTSAAIFSGNYKAGYKNWFDEVAEGLRNDVSEEDAIFGADDINSGVYWAGQIQQLGTTAGIAAEGFLEQALLSLVTAGSRGQTAPLQAARLVSTVRRITLAKQFAFGTLKGVTESVMNAKETYDGVYNEMMSHEGMTHLKATEAAKEAATDHARWEAAPLALLNGLQWMTIGKANPFVKGSGAGLNTGFGGAFETVVDKIMPGVKNKFAKTAIEYGMSTAGETMEEVLQTGIGAMAQRKQDIKHGFTRDEDGNKKDLWNDYIFTHEMRDSAIGGALGGLLFKGMGDVVSRGREKFFGKGEDRKILYKTFSDNIILRGQMDMKAMKEANEAGDINTVNRIRTKNNTSNVASALRLGMIRGDETAFEGYVGQMQSVLNAVENKDQEALDSLGVTSEDLEFIKETYPRMIGDAHRYKTSFQKELDSSISTDIAEEKAQYTQFAYLAEKEREAVQMKVEVEMASIIEDNNIPAGSLQHDLLVATIKLRSAELIVSEENLSANEKKHLEKQQEKHKKELEDIAKRAETLGVPMESVNDLLIENNGILYLQSLTQRLEFSTVEANRRYSELNNVKGQKKRAISVLKSKISKLTKTGYKDVSVSELENTIAQGKANNILSRKDLENLQGKLVQKELQLKRSTVNAEEAQNAPDPEASATEFEELLAEQDRLNRAKEEAEEKARSANEDNQGNEDTQDNNVDGNTEGYDDLGDPDDMSAGSDTTFLSPNAERQGILDVMFSPVQEEAKPSSTPDVILPIGTSGSGKSTFIKSLPQKNLVVIEPDSMRVEFTGDINNKSKDKEIYVEAAKRAVKAIKEGKQVVFDTTNLTKDKRLSFIEAIKKELPTANIQYKLMELNPELAKQRIKAQLQKGENRANVSDSTIDRHAESYKQMLIDIKNEPISNYEKSSQQGLSFAPAEGIGQKTLDAAVSSVKALYNSLKQEYGTTPTFVDLLNDAIAQSKNKSGVDTLYNAFVHGWKANGYAETDFNEAYSSVFMNRSSVVNNLLGLGLEQLAIEEDNSTEIAENENKSKADFDKKNNTVEVVDAEGNKKTSPQTNEEISKFVMKGHFLIIDENNPFQSEFLDARAVVDETTLNEGYAGLEVRIPSTEDLNRIPISFMENGIKRVLPFNSWVQEKGIVEGSDEWLSNVPMIAYDTEKEDRPTFFIHSPEYYNETRVILEDPTEVISIAKKAVLEFRKKVMTSGGKLGITISRRSQGEYHKFSSDKEGIASKPISEVDPSSSMGFVDGDGNVIHYRRRDPKINRNVNTFSSGVVSKGASEDARGTEAGNKDSKVLNFKSATETKEGTISKGKAVHVRAGTNRNQTVVFENYLQNAPEEALNFITEVVEAEALRFYGPEHAERFEKIADKVRDTFGLNIRDHFGDVETLMSAYMNTASRGFSSSDDQFFEVWNAPFKENNIEKFGFTTRNKNILFTVSGRTFGKNGDQKGGIIFRKSRETIEKMDDKEKIAQVANLKRALSVFKDSIMTGNVRVAPSNNMMKAINNNKKAEKPFIGMDNEGNFTEMGKDYLDFLQKNTHTGAKAYNIGEPGGEPKYVTMVNPILEFHVTGETKVHSNFNMEYLAYRNKGRKTAAKTTTNPQKVIELTDKVEVKSGIINTTMTTLTSQSEESVKALAEKIVDTELAEFITVTEKEFLDSVKDSLGFEFKSATEVFEFYTTMTPQTRGVKELGNLIEGFNDKMTNLAVKLHTVLKSKNIPFSYITEHIQKNHKDFAKLKELAESFKFLIEEGLIEITQGGIQIKTENVEQVAVDDSIPADLAQKVLDMGRDLGLSNTSPLMGYFIDLLGDNSVQLSPIGFSEGLVNSVADIMDDTVAGLSLRKTNQIVSFISVYLGGALTKAGKKGINKTQLLAEIKAKFLNTYVSNKKEEANQILTQLRVIPNTSPEFLEAVLNFEFATMVFEDLEQSWDTIAEKSMTKLNKMRGVKESENSLENLSIQEATETTTEENESLSEDQVSDDNIQERNYSKTSIEENGKNTASYNLKKFFEAVEMVNTEGESISGFLGVPTYVGFDKVYNVMETVLSEAKNTPSNFTEMVEILQASVGVHPWMQQVVDKLMDNTKDATGYPINQQIREEFTYNFARHALSMKFTMFYKTRKGEHRLKIYDTNSNAINRVVEQAWRNNFKNSPLTIVNADGTYGISTKVAKELSEQFRGFALKAPTTLELINFLNNFGIRMSGRAMEDYLGSIKNKASLYTSSSSSRNIVSQLGDYVGRMASVPEGTNTNFEENKKEHPFGNSNNTLKALINFEKKYAAYATTSSFRDGQKSIYGFTQSKFATDQTGRLTDTDSSVRDRLEKTPYSSSSYFLDFLMNDDDFRGKFEVDHLGITAMKEMGKTVKKGNEVTSLSNADHELTKLGMFMDTEQASVSSTFNTIKTRMARMFFPTMSDKSQMLLITAPVLDIRGSEFKSLESGILSRELFEAYFSQMITPDLNRMLDFARAKIDKEDNTSKVTNIKGYDLAAQLFLTIPELNNLKGANGDRAIQLMQTDPEKYNADWFRETFYSQAKMIAERQLASAVEQKLKDWTEYGFISKETVNGKEVTTTKFIDDKFLETFENNTKEEAVKLAAYSYIINSRMTTANVYMLYAGDLALYGQNKMSNFFLDGQLDKPKSVEDGGYGDATYAKVVKDIIGVNLGKRLAELLAPGSKIANSKGDSYIQLFLQDVPGITSNTEFLVKTFYGTEESKIAAALYKKYQDATTREGKDEVAKELAQSYPDLADYFDIETTDGQEYITTKEQVDILRRQGRIDNETLATIEQKLEAQAKAENAGLPIPASAMLDYFELKMVMSPIKPVYSGLIDDQVNNVQRMMYIKSSSIPLIPQITKGLELDKVRLLLEKVQNTSGRNVRASYESANKVGHSTGAINLFGADGKFDDSLMDFESFESSTLAKGSLILDRDNFRIQQDVPFKSAKNLEDKVTMGTQPLKLLFGDGVVDFDFGDGVSGRDLLKEYNDSFGNLINMKKESLYKRLGLDKKGKPKNANETILKVHDMLKEEATLRGYPKQDLDALGVIQDGNGNWNFEVPLWLSMNSNRYESLLNAIVTNKLAKLKMPGSSFVVASEAGFQQQSDFAGVQESKIIYTSAWTGSLKAADIGTDESGKSFVKKTQVLLPSKFRMPDGTMLNFFNEDGTPKEQYTFRDENGRLRFKEDMIDAETLLSMFSFRIPTSSHVSLSQVEVVGILPTEAGDLMIVPKNLTKQKGIDFDIDKENVYQHYFFVGEDGKIRKYTDASVLGVEESEVEGIITDAKDIARAYWKARGIEKDLNNLIDESEVLVEYGVEEEHELITSVRKSIERNTKKLTEAEVDKDLYEYARDILKLVGSLKHKEKIESNKILDIHNKVMTHPEMDKRSNKILSMDVAKSQAELIHGLANQQEDSSNFTLTDDKYQMEKMGLGASGKLGIGVYSNYVVFHSMVQQAPPGANIGLLQRDFEGNLYEKDFNIVGVKSDGRLGGKETLASGARKRSITEVLAERQNTATDNEKEQIMGMVNVNEVTINIDSMMVALGYDLVEYDNGKEISLPYLLLSQPIIKDYVSIIRNIRSNTSDFVADAHLKAVEILKNKYQIEPGQTATNLRDVRPSELVGQFANIDPKVQLGVLETFSDLKNYGEQVAKAQKLLNINKDGLGKSFFEATQKFIDLENFAESSGSYINNVESLVGKFQDASELTTADIEKKQKEGANLIGSTLITPNTAVGHMLVNTLKVGQDLWGDFFPYNDRALNAIFDSIIEVIRPNQTVSSTAKVELKQEIFNEVKKYLYANQGFGFYDASQSGEAGLVPAQEERRRLFTDTPGSPSLASYLNEYMYAEADPIFKNGLDAIKDNPILNRFQYKIEKAGEISTIEFDNSKGEAFDEDMYYNAIIALLTEDHPLPSFGKDAYTTRKLASDLIAYAFLEGGRQEAVQFVKYIPMSLLKKTNFGRIVGEYTSENISNGLLQTALGANTNNIYNAAFVTQFFQHNPGRAPRMSAKAITFKEGDNNTFTVNNAEDSNSQSPFLSMYNRTAQKGQSKFELYKATVNGEYVRIDTLDNFGMSQYSQGVPIVESIIGQNKSTGAPINPPVPGTGILPGKRVEGIKPASTKNRFGITRAPITATAMITSIMDSGAANLMPGHFELASILSEYLPNELEVMVADTFMHDGKEYETEMGAAVFAHETGPVGAIYVAPSFYGSASSESFAQTMIHEAFHGVTVNFLKQYITPQGEILQGVKVSEIPVPILDMLDLFKEAKSMFPKEVIEDARKRFRLAQKGIGTGMTTIEAKTIYGVIDIYEFVTMSLTSPQFQKLLDSKTVVSDHVTYKKAFFERVKKLFTALTGVELRPNSLLAKTIDTMLSVVEYEKLDRDNSLSDTQKRNIYNAGETMSIEALLRDSGKFISTVENLGDPDPDPDFDGFDDSDFDPDSDIQGPKDFILAPRGFTNDILNPGVNKDNKEQIPSCK